MELHDGDFTYSKSFSKVQYNEDRSSKMTGRFPASKGHEFITMLVGEVKIGEALDVDAMMARLGLVCDDKGAGEILMLKHEIAELKHQLALALADKGA